MVFACKTWAVYLWVTSSKGIGIPVLVLLGVWLVSALHVCAGVHACIYKYDTCVLIICIALHAKFLTNMCFNLVLLNTELIYELIIKITCLENNLVLSHQAL